MSSATMARVEALAAELAGLPRKDARGHRVDLTPAALARDLIELGAREVSLALGRFGQADPELLVDRARALSEIEPDGSAP